MNNRKYFGATRSSVKTLDSKTGDRFFSKIKPSPVIGATAL